VIVLVMTMIDGHFFSVTLMLLLQLLLLLVELVVVVVLVVLEMVLVVLVTVDRHFWPLELVMVMSSAGSHHRRLTVSVGFGLDATTVGQR